MPYSMDFGRFHVVNRVNVGQLGKAKLKPDQARVVINETKACFEARDLQRRKTFSRGGNLADRFAQAGREFFPENLKFPEKFSK